MGDSIDRLFDEIPLYVQKKGNPLHQFHFRMNLDDGEFIISYLDDFEKALIEVKDSSLKATIEKVVEAVEFKNSTNLYTFFYPKNT